MSYAQTQRSRWACLLDFYPNTDFSLIITRRRTEIFDFYPHTDLLYYDIISTTSGHVETCVLLSKETCKPIEVVSIKVDLDGIKDRF